MRSWLLALLPAALLGAAGPAQARITRVEIIRVEPAFGGRSFGQAGDGRLQRSGWQADVPPGAAA